LQIDPAVGDHVSPYVVRITNDLYQPSEPTDTVLTSRVMQQRTAGAAEAAAATAAAAAVGSSAKATGLNKASASSTTGLVGLRQVLPALMFHLLTSILCCCLFIDFL